MDSRDIGVEAGLESGLINKTDLANENEDPFAVPRKRNTMLKIARVDPFEGTYNHSSFIVGLGPHTGLNEVPGDEGLVPVPDFTIEDVRLVAAQLRELSINMRIQKLSIINRFSLAEGDIDKWYL